MFKYSLDEVTRVKCRGWAKPASSEKLSYALLDNNKVIDKGFIDSFRPDLAKHFADDGCYSFDINVSSDLLDPRLFIYDDENMLEVDISEKVTHSVWLPPWLEVIRNCPSESVFLAVDNCLLLSFLIFNNTGVFPKTITKSELSKVENFDNINVVWRFDKFSPYSVDDEISLFKHISVTCRNIFVELPSFISGSFNPKCNVLSLAIERSDFFRVPTAEKLINYFSENLAVRFIYPSYKYKNISFDIYKLNALLPLIIFVSGATKAGKTNFSRAILGCDSHEQLLSLDLSVSSYINSHFYLSNKSYDKIRANFSLPKFYSILSGDDFLMADFVKFVASHICSNTKKIVIEGAPINKNFCKLFKSYYGPKNAIYWFCEGA